MPVYRIDRINEEMAKEMSVILRELKDPRIKSGLVTITHCDVSADLKFAKIYFSVLNIDAKEVQKGLSSAKGFIRREIASRLNLRNTPELTFIPDDSMEKGAKINQILKDLE